MRIVRGIDLKPESKEEVLPGFSRGFPLISSYTELHKYPGGQAPWHWHKEVELFYVEQGEIEYNTPQGQALFPAGTGGFVNSNVLHMTRAGKHRRVTSLLHLFDPVLIGGQRGSDIDGKYVEPLITAEHIEIIGLYPDKDPRYAQILNILQETFLITEQDYAYEIRLREALSRIWCLLLETAAPYLEEKKENRGKVSGKTKAMMAYVHEHYAEKITVGEIAAAAYISERECFRAFRQCLHMTPLEYLTGYRIQEACRMLLYGNKPVTLIGQACGLGSSSHFGRIFRERMGQTPVEYRRTGGIVI